MCPLLHNSLDADSPIKYSNAPVSTIDVSPTVLDAAGLKHSGEAIQHIGDNERRLRYYNNYSDYDNLYIDGWRRYTINGKVWSETSWSPGALIQQTDKVRTIR